MSPMPIQLHSCALTSAAEKSQLKANSTSVVTTGTKRKKDVEEGALLQLRAAPSCVRSRSSPLWFRKSDSAIYADTRVFVCRPNTDARTQMPEVDALMRAPADACPPPTV